MLELARFKAEQLIKLSTPRAQQLLAGIAFPESIHYSMEMVALVVPLGKRLR